VSPVVPADLLTYLLARGLTARLEGEALKIGPTDLLNDDLRALIRDNKAGLVAALQAEVARMDGPFVAARQVQEALAELEMLKRWNAEARIGAAEQARREGTLPGGNGVARATGGKPTAPPKAKASASLFG
jgi:hypothetical protein